MADKDSLNWEQFAELKKKLGPRSPDPLQNKIFRQVLLEQFSDTEILQEMGLRKIPIIITEDRMIQKLEAEGKYVVVPLDTSP